MLRAEFFYWVHPPLIFLYFLEVLKCGNGNLNVGFYDFFQRFYSIGFHSKIFYELSISKFLDPYFGAKLFAVNSNSFARVPIFFQSSFRSHERKTSSSKSKSNIKKFQTPVNYQIITKKFLTSNKNLIYYLLLLENTKNNRILKFFSSEIKFQFPAK